MSRHSCTRGRCRQPTAYVCRAVGFVPADLSWLTATTRSSCTGQRAPSPQRDRALDLRRQRRGPARPRPLPRLLHALGRGLAARALGTVVRRRLSPSSARRRGRRRDRRVFVLFPRSRVLVLVPARSFVDAIEVPAVFVAAAWFSLQALSSRAGPALRHRAVALAHVGGSVAGMLAVWLFSVPNGSAWSGGTGRSQMASRS